MQAWAADFHIDEAVVWSGCSLLSSWPVVQLSDLSATASKIGSAAGVGSELLPPVRLFLWGRHPKRRRRERKHNGKGFPDRPHDCRCCRDRDGRIRHSIV